MLQYFVSLKEYFKLWGVKARIDNEFSKFHYRYTSAILLACCLLVGSKEIFGHDLKCDLQSMQATGDFLNQYCYYQYLYTVVNETDLGQPVMKGILGLGEMEKGDGYTRRYHTYYQWVAIVLLLQALAFHLPHFIWKKIEGGRIKTLVDGLELAKYSHGDETVSGKDCVIPSKKEVQKKIDVIKKDVLLRFHTSCSWAVGLVLSEALSLANVLLQVHLTNVFLDGLFMRLGYVAAEHDIILKDVRYPPMTKIFPKIASCDYGHSSTSGKITFQSTICILQQNNTNDKVFLTLWYWYWLLLAVSAVAILWRLLTMVAFKSKWFNRTQFNRRFNPPQLYTVAKVGTFSDWLFLSYLHKNTSRAIFNDIVSSISSELEERFRPENRKHINNDAFENAATLPRKAFTMNHV